MTNEILPCPFCGCKPRTESYIPDAVACPNGHTVPMLPSEWNRRPQAPQESHGWEKEFDKEFPIPCGDCDTSGCLCFERENFKAFIRSLQSPPERKE